MNPNQAVDDAQSKFQQVLARFKDNLKSLRTGRASASMLDGVMVEVYGTQLPLNQAATITAPEAQLIQITPFDPNNLAAIAAAIRNDQSLGMNPSDDGRVVRVPVPPLNEERRRDLAKQVGQKQEEAMISLRNIRHDALDIIDKVKKNKELGEDDAKRLGSQIEDDMNKVRSEIEVTAKVKEADILSL